MWRRRRGFICGTAPPGRDERSLHGSPRGMSQPDETLGAALWLAHCAAGGCSAVLRLLDRLSVPMLWSASERDLESLGLRKGTAQVLVAKRQAFDLKQAWAKLSEADVRLIPYGHPLYPPELTRLRYPPAGLFLKGHLARWREVLIAPRVTIVGTRRATGYGLGVARALGNAFSAAGVVVASGLAYGIDTQAHRGALEASAPPLAVVGGGSDIVYPAGQAHLHRLVAAKGCIVSEYPPGMRPARWTFPARNRILAALADAVVVVEAGERSGALITAGEALDLGKPVFAVPGRLGVPQSLGCNRLAAEGAQVVYAVDQCVQDYAALTRIDRGDRALSRPAASESARAESEAEDGPLVRLVLAALGADGRPVDEIAGIVGCSAREAATVLSRLELGGRVVRHELGIYGLPP